MQGTRALQYGHLYKRPRHIGHRQRNLLDVALKNATSRRTFGPGKLTLLPA